MLVRTSVRSWALILSVLILACSGRAQYAITTVAGGALPATPIVGVKASIGSPVAIAVDSNGNVYFTGGMDLTSDSHCIYRIDRKGVMSRIAGTGRKGYSGDGGPATSAQLSFPSGLAVDSLGNLYIADTLNRRVRKISPDGVISTVAEPPIRPKEIAVDTAGNLYIIDITKLVRKISTNGEITSVAYSGNYGASADVRPGGTAIFTAEGVAVDGAGNLYVAEGSNYRVQKVSPAGTISTVAGNGTRGYSGDGGPATDAQLSEPTALTIDPGGNLYIAESMNRIRKVSPSGVITTVAGNGTYGYSGDGRPATNAQLAVAYGVGVDSAGNLYIADTQNNRVRKVSSTGVITTIAGNGRTSYSGDGGLATKAQLYMPNGVATDSGGNLYIADVGNNRIRKVTSNGVIMTLAESGSSGEAGKGGIAPTGQLFGSPNDGVQQYYPIGMVVDSAGNLYVAATGHRVRKVSPSGVVGAIAVGGGSGMAAYSRNDYYENPQLGGTGLAIDSAENLYVAGGGDRIWKISPSGAIAAVAGNGVRTVPQGDVILPSFSGDGGPATSAQLAGPVGVAVDSAGELYIADSANIRIRKVSQDGTITTIAGGGTQGYSGDGEPATKAAFYLLQAVAVDSAGNIYIADTLNNRIRRVSREGMITTIAGDGTPGYFGDGGAATNAQLNSPRALAVDSAGDIFVADSGNNAVRKLIPIGDARDKAAASSAKP